MKIKVLLLVFAMILTMIVPAQANTTLPQEKFQQAEEIYGNYVISVKAGDTWSEVGALSFGKNQTKKTIDIVNYLNEENTIVKLSQNGGGSAYLDAVFLDNEPAVKANDEGGKLLKKLLQVDLDITPIGEEGILLEFKSCKDSTLTVVGRIEPIVIGKQPLQFPAANNYKLKDEVKDFYTYTLGSNYGTIATDGILDEVNLEPFVQEYRIPGSGHPAGNTYFWVMNDDENLYVTMDVTPDNTFDGDKDYAKVYINADDGVKEFKISIPETKWGKTGFTYTDKVAYEHKVYEFTIPLSEISNSKKDISIAFVVYGTVAMPTEFYTPDLAYDAYKDVYVCVYEGDYYYGDDVQSYIWADIINSDGTTLNENPLLISNHGKDLFNPSIAYDFLNDAFMVVWCQGYSNTKVYGKVFELKEYSEDLYIDFTSEEFRISENEDISGEEWKYFDELEPDVAFNRNYEDENYNGSFFVAWSQRVNDNPANLSRTEDDIYGRFVYHDEKFGGHQFAICNEPSRQVKPSISYSMGNEIFMITWLSEHSDMNSIHACVINEDGTLGDCIKSIDGNVMNPSITVNESNDYFLLTWIEEEIITKQVKVKGAYLFYDGSSIEVMDDEIYNIFNISSTDEFYKEYPVSIYGKSNILCLWNSLYNNIEEDYNDSFVNLRYIGQYEPFGSVFETSEPEVTENYQMDKSVDIASNYLNETQRNEKFLIAYVNKGREKISYRVVGEPPEFEPYIEFDRDEYNIDLNSNNTVQTKVFHFYSEDQVEGTNVTNSEFLQFKSNDESVATISNTGLITGLSNGTTTIEAVYYDPPRYLMAIDDESKLPYGALHAVATITVSNTKPGEPTLTFVPNHIEKFVGDNFNVKINYFDGLETIDVTNNAVINIDDSNVAVTDSAIKGEIICKSAGVTTLITTHAGIEATATLIVKERIVSSVNSTPKTPIGEILVNNKVIKTLYKEDVKMKNNTYTFTAENEGDTAKFWLNSSFYKDLSKNNPNKVINFIWDRGTYTLPLNCDEVLDEIGSSAKKVVISIKKVDDKKIIESAKDSALKMGGKVISDLINFSVVVEKLNGNTNIDSLDFYALRTINELDSITKYTSTAMKYVEDKEILTFAPSLFDNNKATIKYRGNGIFTIIENPQTFNDIESHWAKINIEKLASRNIAFGRQNRQFDPNDFITRAEFAVMITRALGITEEESSNSFKDVANEWFAEDISTAFEAGLINGRNDGKFYPNEKIKRKDMAVMINNALKFADKEIKISDIEKVLTIFNDKSIIDEYAKESTAVCANAGIIMGRDTKNFDPDENATRAEASAIIERMLRFLEFMD